MSNEKKYSSEFDFISLLQKGRYTTPNDFTIKMGELIKDARKEKGYSQVELAKKINRRPATISEIENGKSDITVLTLTVFAIVLQKPISYFFPPSLVSKMILDVNTTFQREILVIAKQIENFGDVELSKTLLKLLGDYYEEKFENMHEGGS